MSAQGQQDPDNNNASFETLTFAPKQVDVPWEKVERTEPLVEAALGEKRTDPSVVEKARKLEKFYPYLIQWRVDLEQDTVEDLVRLFRLAQIVLEARTMLHEEELSRSLTHRGEKEGPKAAELMKEVESLRAEVEREQRMNHAVESEREAVREEQVRLRAEVKELSQQLEQAAEEAETKARRAVAEKEEEIAELRKQLGGREGATEEEAEEQLKAAREREEDLQAKLKEEQEKREKEEQERAAAVRSLEEQQRATGKALEQQASLQTKVAELEREVEEGRQQGGQNGTEHQEALEARAEAQTWKRKYEEAILEMTRQANAVAQDCVQGWAREKQRRSQSPPLAAHPPLALRAHGEAGALATREGGKEGEEGEEWREGEEGGGAESAQNEIMAAQSALAEGLRELQVPVASCFLNPDGS